MTGVARFELRAIAPGSRRAFVAACGLFLLLGASLAPRAEAAPKVPPGMIPYDKPVFKNGRRVLWHGPSRGSRAAKAARSAPRAAAPSGSPPPAPAARGSADPVDPPAAVKAGALGAAVAAPAMTAPAPEPVRLTLSMDPRLGAELAQALAPKGILLTATNDAGADLVVAPMPMAGAPAPKGLVAIARMFDCEIALIGAGGLRAIGDLAGKRVAVAPETTGAGRVARRLFAAAATSVVFVETTAEGAPAALREGRADAYVAVSPALRLDDAPAGAKALSVPYTGAVRDQFLPAELGRATFPLLIDRDSVDTVAQPMILAAADPDRDPGRRAALARFTEVFFAALGAGALPDAKWRDVNPAAKLPISRFEAAQAWLEKALIDKARAN